MKKIKACFVGIGSIAKRHIRNLHIVCAERNIELHVDAYRRSPNQVEGVEVVYDSLETVPDDYDAIFITNPTELHLDALKQFHSKGMNFFIEKPVVSINQLDEAQLFKIRDDFVYYVAGPLRYNSVIQWIKNNINPTDVISVRSISSSYLPEWRPGQDYREVYSAKKELGGGVSIDLIHEWDYLVYLFGWPERVRGFMGKKSNLEIDSEDYAIYIAEYLDKVAELHLDYFGRKAIREIELFTKDETIIGDIINNKITFLKTGAVLDFHEKRDDYQKRELNHFINMIAKSNRGYDGYHQGLNVLKLSQMKG